MFSNFKIRFFGLLTSISISRGVMKKFVQKILGISAVLLLVGCARPIIFTNFESGNVLNGQLNGSDRSITVTMPDGDSLSGQYSYLSNASMTFGNAFATSGASSASAFGTSMNTGGQSIIYAVLTSKKSKLVMEIILPYSQWTGQGFGEARTNNGIVYKVQF